MIFITHRTGFKFAVILAGFILVGNILRPSLALAQTSSPSPVTAPATTSTSTSTPTTPVAAASTTPTQTVPPSPNLSPVNASTFLNSGPLSAPTPSSTGNTPTSAATTTTSAATPVAPPDPYELISTKTVQTTTSQNLSIQVAAALGAEDAPKLNLMTALYSDERKADPSLAVVSFNATTGTKQVTLGGSTFVQDKPGSVTFTGTVDFDKNEKPYTVKGTDTNGDGKPDFFVIDDRVLGIGKMVVWWDMNGDGIPEISIMVVTIVPGVASDIYITVYDPATGKMTIKHYRQCYTLDPSCLSNPISDKCLMKEMTVPFSFPK